MEKITVNSRQKKPILCSWCCLVSCSDIILSCWFILQVTESLANLESDLPPLPFFWKRLLNRYILQTTQEDHAGLFGLGIVLGHRFAQSFTAGPVTAEHFISSVLCTVSSAFIFRIKTWPLFYHTLIAVKLPLLDEPFFLVPFCLNCGHHNC